MKKILSFIIVTLLSLPVFVFADVDGDSDANGYLDVAKGGTNSATAANARTALGVPVTAATLVGSCTVGPCLDGTSDGGDLIKLYGPSGFWISLQAGNAVANRNWRLPIDAPPAAGTTRLINVDENTQMGLIDPATFAAALGADDNYVTDAEKIVIGNTSGTNTGDQTSASALTVTATGFDGNLTITDDTVQEVAQKLDDLSITGGYTNLTSFLTQTAWRLFYSDGSGDVKELALGADGEYLKSNGTAVAPSWATPSGAAHDAVSISTDLGNNLLGLSTQQLTLDSQTANYIFAAPNGSAGVPSFRALLAADIPTLNQNTTGTAAGLSGTPNITVGTISAGAGGVTVDADGDMTVKSISTTASDGSRRSIIPNNTSIAPLADGSEEIYNEDGSLKAVENNTEYDIMLSSDIGSAIQSYDADLTTWAEVTSSANGRSLVSAADYAAMRALLDLEAGTDFNAYDADLTTWAGVTPGTGVATSLAVNLDAEGGVAQLIEKGTSTLGTSEIASGACATAVTTAATNAATTDVINWGFNGDPTSTTGYAPTANGMLTIIAYPSTGNVNFKVCNLTAAAITPGAITLNWRIQR